MLPLVLEELLLQAKRVWKQPVRTWINCEPLDSELAAAEKEASSGKQFDRLGLKQAIWAGYKEGTVRCVCKRIGNLARVVAFLPNGVKEPNWSFWARVFEWFGQAKSGKPWPVIYFAADAKREFPGIGQDLGPEHVNGGYTMPCSTHGIYIYRHEESTRVLIHEMVHAACLDEQGWSIPEREAMVETWAELILIALKSKGSSVVAKPLWHAQSHWVSDTNWKAKHNHNTHDLSDYAWRYLGGREEMYRRLGIALPAARAKHGRGTDSLRFTHPSLEV